jgi:hypothetical protein
LAGRTPRDAHDAFAHAYQRALLCVSRAHFNTDGHGGPGALHSADIGTKPTPLLSNQPLGLLVLLSYRIVEVNVPSRQWVVRLTDYYYTLTDATGREMFAYHWHPSGRSSVTWPHLHLGPALGQLSMSATQTHFPTGPVAIEDVIRTAINWFGVRPLRQDWEAALDGTRQLFAELCPSPA